MPITKKGLLVALALPLVTLFQDPATQDPETPEIQDLDIFGRRRESGQAGTVALMQGAWQLMSLDASADYPPAGRGIKGFMVISGPFMAMTAQIIWDDRAGSNLNYSEDYQSFIAEINPKAGGEIECKTLIGAAMDVSSDNLRWEPTGATRKFKVFVDANMMTLSWGAQNRLTFGRRRPNLTGKESFFGVPNAFGGGGSPFGSAGDRDLFGRDRKKRDEEDR